MKESFSFAKWLTNRDIEKIAELLGLEIMLKNDTTKKRILRHKDENGYHIRVFCTDIKQVEADKEIQKTLQGFPSCKKLAGQIFMINAMFASLGNTNSFAEIKNMVMLEFDDFFLTECLSMKNEEELFKFNSKLTSVYQNYMTEKFGRHYTDMKKAHYKKLHKQIREEEEEEENEQKTL